MVGSFDQYLGFSPCGKNTCVNFDPPSEELSPEAAQVYNWVKSPNLFVFSVKPLGKNEFEAQQQNGDVQAAAAVATKEVTQQEVDAVAKPLIESAAEDAGKAVVGPVLGVAALVADFLFNAPATARDEDMLHDAQMSAEHKKGARPSTEEKHDEGVARKQRDQGGDKASKRLGRVPRTRPPGHKGPWPPPGKFAQ